VKAQEATEEDFDRSDSLQQGAILLRTAARWAQACAIVTALLGCFVLLGWIAGIPLLTSYGPDWKPMAPSTALLLVFLGATVVACARAPRRPAVRRATRLVALLCLLTGLTLLISSALGLQWEAEHLGIRIVGMFDGIPLGNMSPVTAFCFVVLGASLLFLPFPAAPFSPWRATAALSCAALVGLTSLVLLLAYLMGAPALYGSKAIPPSLGTSLALLVISTGIGVHASGAIGRTLRRRGDTSPRGSPLLILLFGILAVGIVTTGYLYYGDHQTRYRNEVERQLVAIADLKVDELAQWRRERLGDAEMFTGNPLFAAALRHTLDDPTDRAARADIAACLVEVQSAGDYDRVFLLDASGGEWISVPATGEPAGAHLAQDAVDALGSGEVSFLDFHRDSPGSPIYLGVLAPLFSAPPDNHPLGVLFLRIDPERYLYPFLQRWPTSSATAETLLVRRDGNDVVFLNELRFQKGTALSLRRPLTEESLPAAQAARGREGILEGVDYRGVPVLAALESIPDSPWALVARMDLAEVYAPLREQLLIVVVLVVGLLLFAAAGVGFVWRQQRVLYYRDRYRAAEELRASEGRYRQILDTMMEGYQIVGFDNSYLYINDAAARHGRRAREELLGRTMMEAYPGIETTAMFAALRRCMEDRVAEALENEFTYPDGSSAWFLLSMEPVPQGVIILSLDITSRKRAEESLCTLNAELEQRVKERTAQLEASNEELQAFAYSVSHDLRAPLRAVDGFSRLLEEEYGGKVDAEGRRLLRVVREGTQKMDRLITDLLTLSRATRTEMKRSRVDMTALAEACYRDAASPAVRERFQFTLVPLPDAIGDSSLLRQVWLNLLSNAVKFTERSEIRRIEVGGGRGNTANTYYVKDSGVGFDPDYAHKLFGVFQRLHGAEEFEGTGIGLAIVQRIVHRHGGRVWAEGTVGGGATFYFSLPREEGES
jgi:PAS domain S-box-containing protein